MAHPMEPRLELHPKLAGLMGEFPGTAIFRRFGTLSALNLMRLQAELVEIEEKLQIKQRTDDDAGQPRRNYPSYIPSLKLERATTEGEPGHPNQMALLELAQTKLVTYHELLLSTAEVTQLQRPSDRRFRFLRRWVRMDEGTEHSLEDIEFVQTLEEEFKRDLVALTPGDLEEDNVLSDWFVPKLWAPLAKVFFGLRSLFRPKAGDTKLYEISIFVDVVKWILALLSTIAISLLPSLIILWLFHVKRTITRIWITIAATITIGVLLRIFDAATLKEIFAGTAAFAAVEVVFIGSANGTYAGS